MKAMFSLRYEEYLLKEGRLDEYFDFCVEAEHFTEGGDLCYQQKVHIFLQPGCHSDDHEPVGGCCDTFVFLDPCDGSCKEATRKAEVEIPSYLRVTEERLTRAAAGESVSWLLNGEPQEEVAEG